MKHFNFESLSLLCLFLCFDQGSTLFSNNTASASFWLEDIKHLGVAAFQDSPYQVFRNVKDFGAKGLHSRLPVMEKYLLTYPKGMASAMILQQSIWLSVAATDVGLNLANLQQKAPLSSTSQRGLTAFRLLSSTTIIRRS